MIVLKGWGKAYPYFAYFHTFAPHVHYFPSDQRPGKSLGLRYLDIYRNYVSRKIMPLIFFLIREVLEWIVPVAAAAHFALIAKSTKN